MRITTTMPLVAALAACGGGTHHDGDAPDGGAGGEDAAVEEVPRFRPEACPAGACLWIEAVPSADDVEVTISSRGLGAVFGLSVHLTWDEAILGLDTPDLEGAQRAILGSVGDGDAVMLAAARPGDLALGGTRRSVELGAVSLDDEATLATLHFAIAARGTTRLALTRAVVARTDGALDAVGVAGGDLELPEVAP